jgi:hypothetical protein
VQMRFKKYGDLRLAPTSAQFAGILRFMLVEVKKKDCYQGLLEVPIFAGQQTISETNSPEGECASNNSTLYLEGYAGGQQYHYAVWTARSV